MLVLASPGPSGGPDDNPYIRLLYGSVRAAGEPEALQIRDFDRVSLLHRPDVVHVHWPYYLVRWSRRSVALADIAKLTVLLAIARLRGAALVWTAHDLEPHDVLRPRLWSFFFGIFCRQVDLVVLLSASSQQPLIARYPVLAGKPVRVIPHGHYRDEYAVPPPAQAARASLGIAERPTLLAFGQIRPYKRTAALTRAVLERSDVQLVVAGQPSSAAVRAELLALAGPNLHLFLDVVAHQQVPVFFGACDVVVLPYATGTALNSGVALLALSLGRPVVMVDTPVGRDLQRAVGIEWLVLTSGDPAEVVAAAVELAASRRADPLAETVDLSALDWPEIGKLTVAAYGLPR